MEQYIFAPTVCGAELEEELAAAIEKRTEIFSRASLPGMWKKTDALNRYAARGSRRKGILRKVLPWVLILAGLFLAIPGVMEPKELRTPLIAGAFFMLLGISSLLRQRPARRKGSFRRAAAGMLQNTSGLAEASVQVVFDDEGMKVITLTGKDGGKMAGSADVEIRVPHFGYADRIQEIHIKVIHILIMLIEKEMVKA